MAAINQLSAAATLAAADLLAVYSTANSDARKASLTLLLDWIEDNITSQRNLFTKQTEVPSTDPWTISVTDVDDDIWLIVDQASGATGGTVVFPATPVDQQELLITIADTVTALTCNANGKTAAFTDTGITAAETTLHWKYHAESGVWYLIARMNNG